MSKITITIKDGEVKSKVDGIFGVKCKDVDKFLRQLGEVIKETKTKDYFKAEAEVSNSVHVQR
jgi:hypothetical protein